MTDDFLKKLMVSKAIMDKTTDGGSSTSSRNSRPENMVQEFNMPQAKYNIPEEFLQEQPSMGQGQQPYLSELPRVNTKPVGNPSVDAIKNSKLPDEIKRLMMEHPIAQPQQQVTSISDELVEKATRLMKRNDGNYIPESAKSKQQPQQQVQQTTNGIDYKLIQKMINEAVSNALKENGLLVESSEKSNEIFNFKVGKHIFEGKVTKIKKLS